MNNHPSYNKSVAQIPEYRFYLVGKSRIKTDFMRKKLRVQVVDKSVECVNNFS